MVYTYGAYTISRCVVSNDISRFLLLPLLVPGARVGVFLCYLLSLDCLNVAIVIIETNPKLLGLIHNTVRDNHCKNTHRLHDAPSL